MPTISPEDGYLTVLNVFTTDAPEKQQSLLDEMRSVVDTADFPGWVSSTVHSGLEHPGTANFIQWRTRADLELRYQGEKFRHATIPLFSEISTDMKLLQTEVAFVQRQPALAAIEVSPERGDHTVIEIYGVAEGDQADLVSALGPEQAHLLDVPGYRSHTVLRGVGARYFEGPFVVTYAQWDDQESYDAFRNQPKAEQVAGRRRAQAKVDFLARHYEWNTYRPVHSRSAVG